MKQLRLPQKILICAAPFLLLLAVYILKPYIIGFGKALPSCPFHEMTGMYCPGCGNTRSIIALFNGDIMLALRSNIAPIVLAVVGIILYSEVVMYAFGIQKRSFLRNNTSLFVILGIMAVYYVVRNFIPALLPVDVVW